MELRREVLPVGASCGEQRHGEQDRLSANCPGSCALITETAHVDFINAMVSNWGTSATAELGIVYNRIVNSKKILGLNGAQIERFVDKGDEGYQHRQFAALLEQVKNSNPDLYKLD